MAEEVAVEQLLAVINVAFSKSRDTYGSVKITKSLQQKEVRISHNTVANGYRHLIKQNSLVGSMSRKGNCWDNAVAVAENFFGLIKKEVLNHLHFESRAKAELVIFDYINGWYNPESDSFKTRLYVPE